MKSKEKVKLVSLEGLCAKCKKPLDGRITRAQVAGELKQAWYHRRCVGNEK